MEIEQLPVERDRLGEAPFWDHRIGGLYWVDQIGPSLRRYFPSTGDIQTWTAPATIGCACLTSDEGKIIAALADRFALLDLKSGHWVDIASVPQPRPAVRLSDGRADRSGAFVVGSAVTDFASQDGAIYRLNPDFSVEVLWPEMMLSNAICFQPDGRRMHFTDTRSGVVMVCNYDPSGPLASQPALFADARDHGGSPDGATVDAHGGLWVAEIRTGDVTRFNPDGTFNCQIDLPVPHATSVTFGGKDLDTLFVTTVRETGMQIKTDHPRAGAVFAITGLGVRGVEEGVFELSAAGPTGGQ